MTDSFVQAVILYSALMGVDAPRVVDVEDLPGLRAAQVSFDGYGWLLERDKDGIAYRTQNKELLALHELCHVRYLTAGHEEHFDCVNHYWRQRVRLEQQRRRLRKMREPKEVR